MRITLSTSAGSRPTFDLDLPELGRVDALTEIP